MTGHKANLTVEPEAKAATVNLLFPARGLFPVVGIGASAGGLEAFKRFFGKLPPDSGMAFILVPHLDPDHDSLLTDILQHSTAMPVLAAQDQMTIAPDCVYVIPPNREMSLSQGRLHLSALDWPHGQRLPIDGFMRSLATDQGEQAIGLIFSGTGKDGTEGQQAILDAGGITLVQDPRTAQYPGMPGCAAGNASLVMAVEDMPQALMSGIDGLALRRGTQPAPIAASDMTRILAELRARTGCDFSQYRKSTLSRRIERRMAAHGIKNVNVYVRYLQENAAEARPLLKDLLISVTRFFRDPGAYAQLKQEILPRIRTDVVFRVWVAACASGEEAYSLAILLRELMDETGQEFAVQIYATDLDPQVIGKARAGLYPRDIEADVSGERLARYFTREDGGYKVKQAVRDMLVFAVQDVIKDPPFTKLDLLSCRNLLIYLEPALQARLIAIFHFALNAEGLLLLSPSESIGRHTALFTPVSREWKLFQAIGNPEARRAAFGSGLLWRAARGSRLGETTIMKSKLCEPVTAPPSANEQAAKIQTQTAPPRGKRPAAAAAARVTALERQLTEARHALAAAAQEQQSAVEELRLSVEEMQTTNEELQSTNEELETSREEQQSINEELGSVNAELQSRVEQLSGMQNDMKNLLDNVTAGTILLDKKLLIRRFTREVAPIYRLMASDVGRPLADFKAGLVGEDLIKDAQTVLDTLQPLERESQSGSGRWFQTRVQPYFTLDDRIDGVVLSFTDISEIKRRSEAALASKIKMESMRLARELAQGIVDTVMEPLIVLDGELRVITASRSFYEYFKVKERETVGEKIYALGNGQWDIPALRELLEDILPSQQGFEGYQVTHDFPNLGCRRMVLNAHRIVVAAGASTLILLAMVHEP